MENSFNLQNTYYINTIELILVTCLEILPLYPPKGSAKALSLGFNWFPLIVKLLDNENFHLRTELLLQVQIEINSNQLTQTKVFKLNLR